MHAVPVLLLPTVVSLLTDCCININMTFIFVAFLVSNKIFKSLLNKPDNQIKQKNIFS